jgi:hypothetical protein
MAINAASNQGGMCYFRGISVPSEHRYTRSRGHEPSSWLVRPSDDPSSPLNYDCK